MASDDSLWVQLATLQELWAAEAEGKLSGLLRTAVHVTPASCRPLSLSRARAKLADVSAACGLVFAVEGWQGQGMVNMDLPLALAVVDRLLGGPGFRGLQPRALTEIERQVLQRVFSEAGRLLQRVLGHLAPLHVTLLKEKPPFFADPLGADQAGVEWAFGFQFAGVAGGLRLLLPDPWEWARRPGNAGRGEAASAHGPGGRRQDHGRPDAGRGSQWVAVDVELGSAYLTARELQQLSRGDIVCLPGQDRQVLVKLDGRPAFWAQPCHVGGRMAVRLVSRCPEGEDS